MGNLAEDIDEGSVEVVDGSADGLDSNSSGSFGRRRRNSGGSIVCRKDEDGLDQLPRSMNGLSSSEGRSRARDRGLIDYLHSLMAAVCCLTVVRKPLIMGLRSSSLVEAVGIAETAVKRATKGSTRLRSFIFAYSIVRDDFERN